MNGSHHRWAVVLPGADSRGSPLHDAVRRAGRVVPQERVCVVVENDQHRHWWPLGSIVAPSNLLIQPRNSGTAIAILLAVLEIIDRDPFAHVLFVPADSSFHDEAAVAFAMNRVFGQLSSSALELVLVGVEAEHPASE